MYTSYIGKKFLKLYNQKFGKELSARDFFDSVFFPIFFDDEKHLMHVGNSPFFQKPSAKAMVGGLTKSQAQLKKLHQDVANEVPNMATFVGYAAKGMTGTTSGQLSNINFRIDAEDMYASWIGEALGIGVSGGFVMLLDKEEVLWTLFEGWNLYRKFLKQTDNLKDKQIETWNGKWLTHALSINYNQDEPTENFELNPEEVLGKLAITTQSWSRVVFALAKKYPTKNVIIYAYNLSQTNTTLGFITLCLPEVRKPFELRNKIFIDRQASILSESEIEKLESFFNFKSACKLGIIGLKALEPDKLRDFLPAPFGRNNDFKFSDETSFKQYQLYKLWIISMLNKIELLQLANQIASALHDYESQSKSEGRGKTGTSKEINRIKESKNPKELIESLTDLLEKSKGFADVFQQVVKNILSMPLDHFPLFIALIRFEYQYKKSKA